WTKGTLRWLVCRVLSKHLSCIGLLCTRKLIQSFMHWIDYVIIFLLSHFTSLLITRILPIHLMVRSILLHELKLNGYFVGMNYSLIIPMKFIILRKKTTFWPIF